MRWFPKEDSMYIANLIEPFSMYDSTAFLDGGIVITHKGLKGRGIFNKAESRTVSKSFHFEERRVHAREAEFEILSDIQGKPALLSDYVKVHFELDSGYTNFTPEEKGYASNEFPYLKYKTSLDDGKWLHDERIVTMNSHDDDISKSYFYSTHPDQDSLVFNAVSAVYSIDSLMLHVMGVPEILVADGKIIPDSSQLYIAENANMLPLENAEIIMDTVGEFHHLVEGNIHIESKNKFTGNAKYAYKNIQGDTLFINFNKFDLVDVPVNKKEVEQHTYSQGIITPQDSFLMAPKMYYQGSTSMYANKKKLKLDGAVRLDLYGEIPAPNWLHFIKEDDIDSVILSTKGQVTPTGLPVITGIHYSKARNDYYVTMLGRKGGPKDFSIFKSEGIIYFDQIHNEFLIGDSLRMMHQHYEGNLFAYEPDLERVRIQGLIDIFGHPSEEDIALHPELGAEHPVEVEISAEGDMYLLDNRFEINGLTYVKLDYDAKALDIMGADMAQMSQMFLAPRAYHFNDTIAFEIADIAGEKAAEKLKEDPTVPLAKITKKFGEGIVLTDVHLEWKQDKKAWYSRTDSIGVGSIGKHNVNAMVSGMLEIKKGKGFDYTVNLYLELNERVWYYFSFEKNRLLAGGSNAAYNDIVSSKNTRAKNEPMGAYFFDLAPPSMKKKFVTKFIRTYRDGEGLDDEVMDLELDMDALKEDSLSGLEDDFFDDSLEDEESLSDDDENLMEDDDEILDEELEETEEQEQELEDEIFEELGDEESEEEMTDEIEEDELGDDFMDDESSVEDKEISDDEITDDDFGLEEEKPKKEKKKKKGKKSKATEEEQLED